MQLTQISKHHDTISASLPLNRAAQNMPRRWAWRAGGGFLLITLLGGCQFFPTLDQVLPDRREEYKKHRELEALEIPPDLTQELPTEPPLVVDTPGEASQDSTATHTPNSGPYTPSSDDPILSGTADPGVVDPGVVDPGVVDPGVVDPGVVDPGVVDPGVVDPGVDGPGVVDPGVVDDPGVNAPGVAGGVILQVTSGLEETWPRLREYWINAGHDLNLDDMELGVMETSWSTPYQEDDLQLRDKVTLITEEIDHAGNKLVIHIHYTREMLQEDPDGNPSWLPTAPHPEREKQLAAKLSQHLGVTSG